MATLVAETALDLNAFIQTGSLSEFFEFGTVQTGTATNLVVTYSDATISERLTMTGTFGNYAGGYPTTGTINSISYWLNGSTLFTITNTSISVEAFTAFVQADNLLGLFQQVLGGTDTITGSTGNDVLFGFAGNDTINGNAGNDTLHTGGGTDTVQGGTGDDVIVVDGGIGGNILFNGGDGSDTLRITPAAASLVTPSGNFVPLTFGALNSLTSLETMQFASAPGGTLRVLVRPDQLTGFSTLVGGAGTDVLIVTLPTTGGAFALPTLSLLDWSGSDLVVLSAGGTSTASYTLTTVNHQGVYSLNGAAGNDFLGGSAGIETMFGNGGNDEIRGEGGNDTLDGGDGNDELDGGAGVDSIQGGAGDDVIVYDPNDVASQVNGGTGNDLLLVLDMAAPTGFNLAAQGFEGAIIELNDTGANPWSDIDQLYNVNWQLVQQSTLNDDGSSIRIDYDPTNAVSTNQVWNGFDAQGRLSYVDQLFDDSTRIFINLDESNSQAFAQDWFTYDAQGRLDTQDVHYDSGLRTFINFDQAGDQAFNQDWFTYDAQGRLDTQDVHYDNGTRTFINFDQAGNQGFTQDWFTYDAQGRLDAQDVYYDNGTRTYINFDQDNSQPWSQAWFTYDAQGRLDTQDVFGDDGSRTFYNYDQDNSQSFQVSAILYNPSGVAYQQVTTWDDGSVTYTAL